VKLSTVLFICILFAACTQTKAQVGASTELRQSFMRGYIQFDVAPPHNEIDSNLCLGPPTIDLAKNAGCTAFARYMAGGHVEAYPFYRTHFLHANKVYLFGDPNFLFGDNLPQQKYTWSPAAIGWERSWGIAVNLPKGVEIRFTQHLLFGEFRGYAKSPAYLGPNGPWGRYTIVGVRKYFGYRHENPA
jgi:hypothetical protein